jgi:hypothetical protein
MHFDPTIEAGDTVLKYTRLVLLLLFLTNSVPDTAVASEIRDFK